MSSLAVSETFYSIQGEGATMGIPSVFLRLAGCNLMCGGQGTQFDKELHNGATWRCDTIEVWMNGSKKQYKDVLLPEFIQKLKNGAHLIITGGEPLLQQDSIIGYIEWILDKYDFIPFIEVETNGTIEPHERMLNLIEVWNCSPKLNNSGNQQQARFNKSALQTINIEPGAIFKFVITTKEDFNEILSEFSFLNHEKIWLMPSGENQELLNESKKEVARLCIENNYKYSSRLHIEIWNQKTGV